MNARRRRGERRAEGDEREEQRRPEFAEISRRHELTLADDDFVAVTVAAIAVVVRAYTLGADA